MTRFLQFAILGLGSGAAYALFAQGAVLIYRGSGVVNFAHGALGMLSSYFCFAILRKNDRMAIVPAIVVGILVAIAVALLFQMFILRPLRHAAAIVRLIATLGLLAILQAAIKLKFGGTNIEAAEFLPHSSLRWGAIKVKEQSLYLFGIAVALTTILWALSRFSRVGLAISAASQNERSTQTLGWSPNRLALITWGTGAGLAGFAGILLSPSTGLNPGVFTIVVTVAALAAALLGGFQSFPLTLLGGLIVGVGENLVTLYARDIEKFFHQDKLTGLNRAVPFLVVLFVLIVRGRGLPLRSHVADRLPKLGTGRINIKGLVLGAAIVLFLLFGLMGDRWAAATITTLIGAIMILSIVVVTGYAGQVSLAQWAIAGVGALIAGRLVRTGWPLELAIVASVLLTMAVGVLFALPALRTRGVNLAVVTLGLGFTVSEVVLNNPRWLGSILDGGTKVPEAKLFGIKVDAVTHPHRWAVVSLIAFVGLALMVANLRRSRTGRRLLAVRTNERAAASLGISVFTVKIYAFGVAAAIAAVAGILSGFQSTIITYYSFNVFASINSVGHAVIGGLGFVLAGVLGAANAIGGLGTRVLDAIDIGKWDELFGGTVLLLILLAQPDGAAAVVTQHIKPLLKLLHLSSKPVVPSTLSETPGVPVRAVTLEINGLSVRFGGVKAVDEVSFSVHPGEVVGLIGPNGAGKTTIIDAVTGFVKPSAGMLSLNDQRVEEWSAAKRACAGLRRSFQSLELFEDISVEDNIRAGDDTGTVWSWLTDLFWPGKHELSPTAVSAIREFELQGAMAMLPGELSYGRRRLVGIARAVANGPSIIMLDEPAAGLDEAESRELAALIRRLADDRKMGVLLVEHDVGLVMSTCDRIVVIDFGQVVASGTPAQIRVNPAVLAAYLGHDSSHGDDDRSEDGRGREGPPQDQDPSAVGSLEVQP